MRFICKTILFLLLAVPFAQGQAILTDSIPKGQMWIPTSIKIGTDIISFGRSGLSDFTEQWEVSTEIDLYRFYAVLDIGHHNYRVNQDTSRTNHVNYLSTGYYGRVGLDANLISNDRYGGNLFLGFRYARTNYEEYMSGSKNVDGWGVTQFFEYQDMNAYWLEIVTGIKAQVWKGLTMGYTLRLKFAPSPTGAQNIEPYWIPGYGLASQNNYWSMSYYIYWTFKWKDKFLPPRK